MQLCAPALIASTAVSSLIAPGPAMTRIPRGHDRRVHALAAGSLLLSVLKRSHGDRGEDDAPGDLEGGHGDAEEREDGSSRGGEHRHDRRGREAARSAARRRLSGKSAVIATKIGAAEIGLITEKREENASSANCFSAGVSIDRAGLSSNTANLAGGA
jgi:hypothetical protein